MLPSHLRQQQVDLREGEVLRKEEDDFGEVVEFKGLSDALAKCEDLFEVLLVEAPQHYAIEDVETHTTAAHSDYLSDVICLVDCLSTLLLLLLLVYSENGAHMAIALESFDC